MSESLDMLKSEEGQLNAVFACFGSAVQHAQLLEEELRQFLDIYNGLTKSHIRLDALEGDRIEKSRKTMGALLKQIRKHVRFHEETIERALNEVLEQRNFLAHHFFLERNEKFRSARGRMEMIRELSHVERRLETVRGWIAGLRVAMLDVTSGKRRPLGGEVVFSATIDLPD